MYYSGHFAGLSGENFAASLQPGKFEKWTNKSDAPNRITKFRLGLLVRSIAKGLTRMAVLNTCYERPEMD